MNVLPFSSAAVYQVNNLTIISKDKWGDKEQIGNFKHIYSMIHVKGREIYKDNDLQSGNISGKYVCLLINGYWSHG